MKTLICAVALLACAFVCNEASAWNGVAVRAVRFPIARAVVSPRVALVRQPVVVAPVVQPFVLRQRFVAPLYVQPQALFVPQMYVQPQAFVYQQSFAVPQVQVQSFSTGCQSAAFFVH